jgi:hypothetical protein
LEHWICILFLLFSNAAVCAKPDFFFCIFYYYFQMCLLNSLYFLCLLVYFWGLLVSSVECKGLLVTLDWVCT